MDGKKKRGKGRTNIQRAFFWNFTLCAPSAACLILLHQGSLRCSRLFWLSRQLLLLSKNVLPPCRKDWHDRSFCKNSPAFVRTYPQPSRIINSSSSIPARLLPYLLVTAARYLASPRLCSAPPLCHSPPPRSSISHLLPASSPPLCCSPLAKESPAMRLALICQESPDPASARPDPISRDAMVSGEGGGVERGAKHELAMIRHRRSSSSSPRRRSSSGRGRSGRSRPYVAGCSSARRTPCSADESIACYAKGFEIQTGVLG